jgi:hypothetical protein
VRLAGRDHQRVSGAEPVHVPLRRDVEPTPEDVDQLRVRLEAVWLVAAAPARLDPGFDHLEGTLPSWREEFVFDPVPAEVRRGPLLSADQVCAVLLEERPDPDSKRPARS